MKIKLTKDQKRGMSKAEWFLSDAEAQYMTIAGSAGTGKTTLARIIVKRYMNEYNFLMCGPTHKSVAVLAQFVMSLGMAKQCKTIHSAFGLLVKGDAKERYVVSRGVSDAFRAADVIIIDEASMVGPKLWKHIREAVELHKKKVIFLGDPYQLQPVKDGKHVAFSTAHVPTHVKLREIVRQEKDNPIIQRAVEYREAIDARMPPRDLIEDAKSTKGHGIYLVDPSEFVKEFIITAKNALIGEVRGLTYTKDRARDLSDAYRMTRYGEKSAKGWMKDEWVMNLEHVKHVETGLELHSSQECKVAQTVIDTWVAHPQYPKLVVMPVMLRPLTPALKVSRSAPPIIAFVPKDMKVYLAMQGEMKLKAQTSETKLGRDHKQTRQLWEEYHKFQDRTTRLISAYVSTTHRAQGSTFGAVYIDAADIDGGLGGKRQMDLKLRLHYVALTRARNSANVSAFDGSWDEE